MLCSWRDKAPPLYLSNATSRIIEAGKCLLRFSAADGTPRLSSYLGNLGGTSLALPFAPSLHAPRFLLLFDGPGAASCVCDLTFAPYRSMCHEIPSLYKTATASKRQYSSGSKGSLAGLIAAEPNYDITTTFSPGCSAPLGQSIEWPIPTAYCSTWPDSGKDWIRSMQVEARREPCAGHLANRCARNRRRNASLTALVLVIRVDWMAILARCDESGAHAFSGQ